MRKKILIMAGGTGGHIFPALAVAEALTARGIEVAWLGRAAGMEADIVAKAGLPLFTIEVGGLRGHGWQRLLLAPWQLLRALKQAMQHMQRWQPDLVLGFGGYASGPGGVAAFLRRIPLCIQEQNAVPGYTNRILAKMAKKVFAAFPSAFAGNKKVTITGNPLRRSLLQLLEPQTRLGSRQGPVHILVMGGSQGAKALNEAVPKALKTALDADMVRVRHQSGQRHYDAAVAAYANMNGVEVLPFIDDMAAAYNWADLVIARAGAATVSEMAAIGLASVLVPYPYAVDDHQAKNAAYLTEGGAACVIAEKDSASLESILTPAFLKREALLGMAKAAYALGRKDATEIIVEDSLGVLGAK